MNALTKRLLDASESLTTPMHSTNQASQHTPGPWSVLPYSIFGGRVQSFVGPPDHSLNDDTCTAVCTGPDHEANARLIAAAPDLLAALELVAFTIDAHDGESCPKWILGIRAQARAAFARATQS